MKGERKRRGGRASNFYAALKKACQGQREGQSQDFALEQSSVKHKGPGTNTTSTFTALKQPGETVTSVWKLLQIQSGETGALQPSTISIAGSLEEQSERCTSQVGRDQFQLQIEMEGKAKTYTTYKYYKILNK